MYKTFYKFIDYIFTKQWYKPIFFIFIILLFSIIPSNAQIINGYFNTGDFTGWVHNHDGVTRFAQATSYFGHIHCSTNRWDNPVIVYQNFSSTGFSYLTLDFNSNQDSRNQIVQIYNYDTETVIYQENFKLLDRWDYLNISLDDNQGNLKLSFIVYTSYACRFDNIVLSGEGPAATILEFDKTPYYENNDTTIHWDISDYIGTHTNELFRLEVTTNGTIRGTDFIQTYQIPSYAGISGNWNNHLYDLTNDSINGTYSAKMWYSYHDPVYHEGYILDSYISTDILSDNYTYVPPEPEPEPEPPDIPDPEPDPDLPDVPEFPDEPPVYNGSNQSINVSWVEGYYSKVNGTVNGLCTPIYNFTYWSLSPIYSLNSSVSDFNGYMNTSFTQTTEDSSILYESINTIFNAIPPKVRNVITYYLIWIVLLIILKKD